ncbi:LysE family translocator [Shewanella acanthi]|uniref:LysE family translocator n=1 Tax=Shewanella acanthi TaxID=2864212 RepID=UPI001C661603|nr:LysE family transporter [Shewanella acanthi]QYJ78387.1 LysE family transporter [Shewanella acanthi]
MDLSLLATLAMIHSVALVSPGPDFAIMLKIATSQARRTAIATALGISVAILVHTILSLTGVSLVIKSSHNLYLLVQLIGASYLAWMGYGALRAVIGQFFKAKTEVELVGSPIKESRDTQGNEETAAHPSVTAKHLKSVRQGFMTGLYTNLLNPKALVFFLTLFSALITPSVTVATKVTASVLLFSLSFIWFGTLALVLSKPQVQQKLTRITPIIDAIIGVIFISVAIAIVVSLFSV